MGTHPEFKQTKTFSVMYPGAFLVFSKQNGTWKISQYQSQKSRIRPGEFSGFLMENITK